MRWSKHENKKIHPILSWHHMCLCKLLGWIVECDLCELVDIYPFSMLLFCNFCGWTFGSNGNKYTYWTFGYKVSLWPNPTSSFKSKFCKSPFPCIDLLPSSTSYTFTTVVWFEIYKSAPTFTCLLLLLGLLSQLKYNL
jgi:hypothetical protein